MLNKLNFEIHTFCAKNSLRPEINGVFVEPNRTTATDSFVLITITTPKRDNIKDFPIIPNKPKPQDNFKSFILPQVEAKKLLSTFPLKPQLPILENAVVYHSNGETVEIGTTNLESFGGVLCRIIQEKYPNCNDILTERGKFTEITLNPVYLKKIGEFFEKLNKEIKVKIPLKPNQPIRFYGINEKDSTQTATAVLMPIKSND